MVAAAGAAFEHGDHAQTIRLLDGFFGDVAYSLKSLFRDEQRRILDVILASTLAETEDELRDVFLHHAPLMRFLRSLGSPLPKSFRAAAEVVLNVDLRRAFEAPSIDSEEIERLLEEARTLGVDLDVKGLSYALEKALLEKLDDLEREPDDADLLSRLAPIVDLARSAPFQVDLWQAQNRCYGLLQAVAPGEQLRRLAEKLGVRALMAHPLQYPPTRVDTALDLSRPAPP
jgi:hypothetical protein